MSYSVQLDEQTRAKLAAWKLPKVGIHAVFQRMDDLSEMPSRHLLRIDSAEHVLQCDVLYRDPAPPGRDCLIILSVRYQADEETLSIVDCYRVCSDEL